MRLFAKALIRIGKYRGPEGQCDKQHLKRRKRRYQEKFSFQSHDLMQFKVKQSIDKKTKMKKNDFHALRNGFRPLDFRWYGVLRSTQAN